MAIKFGVIGNGPWGTKVAAAISALGFACESCSARGDGYKRLAMFSDVVFVAAHPDVNFDIAMYSMAMGKLVIVEKPVSLDADKVGELLRFSRNANVSFIVDYIYLFNEGVLGLKNDGIKRLSITLGNNGPVRDYSPLWDYGSHAVAVVLDFIRRPLTRIEMIVPGSRYLLHFGSVIAEINVSKAFSERMSRFETSDGYAAKFEDTYQHNPLAALISTAARLHLRGEYWTNADLAVEVTDLLERMKRMENVRISDREEGASK